MSRTPWEYQQAIIPPEALAECLSDLGAEGWELCGSPLMVAAKASPLDPQPTAGLLLIFKRPALETHKANGSRILT